MITYDLIGPHQHERRIPFDTGRYQDALIPAGTTVLDVLYRTSDLRSDIYIYGSGAAPSHLCVQYLECYAMVKAVRYTICSHGLSDSQAVGS